MDHSSTGWSSPKLVTLETTGEAYMAVGRRPSQYIVYLTFDNEQFHSVIEPSQLASEASLVVGGQAGLYRAKLCVDVETALKAAKAFAESGTLEPSLNWEQEGVVEAVSN